MAVTGIASAASRATAGGDAVVDLTSYNVGDLCIMWLKISGLDSCTLPAGSTWTATVNATGTCLARRVKQSGDTTFTFGIPGTRDSSWVLEVWRDAVWREASPVFFGAASGNAINWDAVTIDNTSSVSLLLSNWDGGATTLTYPGAPDWTSRNDGLTSVVNGSTARTGIRTSPPAGALDPATGTLGANRTNRTGYHVELGDPNVTGGGSLSGSGDASATGTRTVIGAAALSGSGDLSGTGRLEARGGGNLPGSCALSAMGVRTAIGAGEFTGSGDLTADGVHTGIGGGEIAGAGSVSGSGVIEGIAAGELIGSGSLSATGTREQMSGAEASGSGELSASGTVVLTGGGGVSGSGALSATGIRGVATGGALGGFGLVQAAGSLTAFGAGALSGSSEISGEGERTTFAGGELEGEGQASGRGLVTTNRQTFGPSTPTFPFSQPDTPRF